MAAEDLNKNLGNANKNAQDLKDALGDILFEQRSLADEARGFAKAVFDSNIQAQATAKAFRDASNATRDLGREISDVISGEKSRTDFQKDLAKARKAEKNLLLEAEQALKVMGFSQNEITQALNEQEGIYKLLDNSSQNLTNSQFDLAELYARQLESLELSNDEMEELEKRAKVIEGSMGITPKIGGALGDIMKKVGGGKFADALGLDQAFKDSRKLTAEMTKGGTEKLGSMGKLKVAGNFMSSIAKNFAKSLGPITLIAELIQGIGRADKSITEIAKSMSLSKNSAEDIYSAFGGAAADSGNINITTEKMVKNFTELNKQLGFINNFTMGTLVTMTKLTEQVGLSAQEAGGLVTLSEARGKNAEIEYKAALGATYELQRQSGIQLDNREVLKAISSTTGQIRANLAANPAEIAKAVTLAKQLGGSLDDVKAISSAILDFESSIANELEAEVLTGKELNLEKARLAALNGDIVGLEKEIASQIGTFTEFSKMNVIQQEALAKSFGLSSDKLSDMLFNQQVMGRSAKELRALGEDELANRLEQQTTADKFNKTVEKLKGIFSDVGGALVPVVELLGFAFSIVGAIAAVVMDIIRMLKGDFDFSSTAAAFGNIGEQLGISGGGGNPSSFSSRPGNSSSKDMTEMKEYLKVIANKDPNINLDGRRMNDGMNVSLVGRNIGA